MRRAGSLNKGPEDARWREIIRRAEADILARTGNRREAMFAFDAGGREILSKVGDEDEIAFSPDDLRRLVGQTRLAIHNHDDNTPPSSQDLAFAAFVAPKELITFGEQVRWRLLRQPGWPEPQQLFAAFNRADRRVTRELFALRRAGQFAGDPFEWRDRSEHVWDRLQRDHPGWFILVKEERDGGGRRETINEP
jgi:hypothetical protein